MLRKASSEHFPLRSNNTGYMRYVRRWYEQLAAQTKGLYFADMSSKSANYCFSSAERRATRLDSPPSPSLLAPSAPLLTACAPARPTIRLRVTGSEPELTLPADKQFHAFLSHVWGTGQAPLCSSVQPAFPPCANVYARICFWRRTKCTRSCASCSC